MVNKLEALLESYHQLTNNEKQTCSRPYVYIFFSWLKHAIINEDTCPAYNESCMQNSYNWMSFRAWKCRTLSLCYLRRHIHIFRGVIDFVQVCVLWSSYVIGSYNITNSITITCMERREFSTKRTQYLKIIHPLLQFLFHCSVEIRKHIEQTTNSWKQHYERLRDEM